MPPGFEITLRPAAREDLGEIYDWIAERGSAHTAIGYIRRIQRSYRSLTFFPERGTRRDDLYPGLRTFGVERRVTIAFRIDAQQIVIMRILYGGRDLKGAFDQGTF